MKGNPEYYLLLCVFFFVEWNVLRNNSDVRTPASCYISFRLKEYRPLSLFETLLIMYWNQTPKQTDSFIYLFWEIQPKTVTILKQTQPPSCQFRYKIVSYQNLDVIPSWCKNVERSTFRLWIESICVSGTVPSSGLNRVSIMYSCDDRSGNSFRNFVFLQIWKTAGSLQYVCACVCVCVSFWRRGGTAKLS